MLVSTVLVNTDSFQLKNLPLGDAQFVVHISPEGKSSNCLKKVGDIYIERESTFKYELIHSLSDDVQ